MRYGSHARWYPPGLPLSPLPLALRQSERALLVLPPQPQRQVVWFLGIPPSLLHGLLLFPYLLPGALHRRAFHRMDVLPAESHFHPYSLLPSLHTKRFQTPFPGPFQHHRRFPLLPDPAGELLPPAEDLFLPCFPSLPGFLFPVPLPLPVYFPGSPPSDRLQYFQFQLLFSLPYQHLLSLPKKKQ